MEVQRAPNAFTTSNDHGAPRGTNALRRKFQIEKSLIECHWAGFQILRSFARQKNLRKTLGKYR